MTPWRSGPLTPHHRTETFDSGRPTLDRWLRESALRAQLQGTAHTCAWTDGDDPRVRAYYAVAPTEVRRADVSSGLVGGVSRIPAYLLARLALDRDLQGRGLGSQLLLDALEVVVAAADVAGGRLVVVDAIDAAAAAFYRHHDFRAVDFRAVDDGTDDARLYLKIASARRALGIS